MAFNAPGAGPAGGAHLHRPLADINVTPMVDVMLVLLIVFMVTAPMLATGLKVDLPQARTAQTIDPKEPVIVSITTDGTIALGTDPISLADLVPAIAALTGNDAQRIIQIRADKAASYGPVIAVIDTLAANGMVRIALVSDAKAPLSTTPGLPGPAR